MRRIEPEQLIKADPGTPIRQALDQGSLGVSSPSVRTTMKSLPKPCIFVKGMRMYLFVLRAVRVIIEVAPVRRELVRQLFTNGH